MADSTGRDHTWQILRDVVAQLSPSALVADAIRVESDRLSINGVEDEIPLPGRVVVLAVGKASVPMAAGALESLDDQVANALAVTKAGIPRTVDPRERLEIIEADHPVPSTASMEAGQRVLELVGGLSADDLVVMLISGGGSALIEDLVTGVTLDDLRQTTEHLLRAGATINELNAVRKRLSRIKGGRLARTIAPAKVVNLIISDVLGNPLHDIASGPTVQSLDDDPTFESVMSRTDLIRGLPDTVRAHLTSEQAPEDAWPGNVLGTQILADASTAAMAAVESASRLGYQVQTIGFDFQGEAREFGRTFATIARHAASGWTGTPLPLALVGSGELTVTVQGDGIGGRNTEMALAAALNLAGSDAITIASFATDGDDGVSGCAGGIVDGDTIRRLHDAGVDPSAVMQNNDSASALGSIGGVIDIGPTGTNVNDLYLALIQTG